MLGAALKNAALLILKVLGLDYTNDDDNTAFEGAKSAGIDGGLVGTNRGSFRLSRTKCLCCVAPKAVGVGSQANAADELGEELPSARDCQLWEDLCSGRLEVVRNATSTAQKAEEEAAALRAFSAEYEARRPSRGPSTAT
eukprot:gene18132-21597_t